ncbi:hypothetical protein ACFPTY_18640 [Halomonas beimenensis]|uniref:ApeA N-terminal domain-containing protein n=1 Tax=Halomonas beimenensis TaxID=475662 RepID=A0A291P2W9_9GAMM|nr:hypothetical protein [Halomonas beimenensis]ATJ81236.1 hypothetical protein BEI_0249 [Halomonas beimenensis]
MMQLKGSAKITNGTQEYPVLVVFDVELGRCLISETSETSSGGFFKFWLGVSGDLFLKELKLSGGRQLYSDLAGPFFFFSSVESTSFRDEEVSQCGVATALGVKDVSEEIDEIEIKPYSSEILLNVDGSSLSDGSEILFHCAPRRKMDFTVKLDGEEVRVHTFDHGTSLSKYVRCHSSRLQLVDYLKEMDIALSLLLGRRVFWHFYRNESEIRVNLAKPGQALSNGMLVSDASSYRVIFERLLSHPLCLQRYFLIEAFSNPRPLEVRLLNAFVYLEFLSATSSLDKGVVSERLEISRDSADVIVRVRNEMIHKGLGVLEALKKARHALSSNRRKESLEVIDKILESESPSANFYGALMHACSRALVSEVGGDKDLVSKKVEFVF